MTSIREFLGYFSKRELTETSSHQEPALFVPDPRCPDILSEMTSDRFIYHVAIDPIAGGMGIGSKLLRMAIEDAPAGLVADILGEPIASLASEGFRGFRCDSHI